MQGVIPMLSYEDGVATMEWLARAFGFVERARMLGSDGRLSHGEMDTGGGTIMLATPSPNYHSPKRHRDECETSARWQDVPWVIDGVLVYVDNIDGHFERARAAGATMLTGIDRGSPGDRYRVEDLEGHRWMFMQRPA